MSSQRIEKGDGADGFNLMEVRDRPAAPKAIAVRHAIAYIARNFHSF